MADQCLDLYKLPSDWNPGANPFIYLLWFCIGSPVLSTRWLPGSGWRVWLLRSFGSQIGSGCRLKTGLRVKFPWRFIVGNHCWIGEDTWIDNLVLVELSNRVCISQGVYFCTGNHDYRSPGFDLCAKKIFISSDVWIAARSVLAPGSFVGLGAVVALGSVVSGKVPPGVIVRGNPAVIIGKR